MSRDLIQKAVTALEWVNDNTADEMPIVDAALFDLRAELAKPAAVTADWVMVPKEATNDMYFAWCRSNTDWRNRYADMLSAAPQLPAPAILPVDVEAVREVIAELREYAEMEHVWAYKLARAIGDKNDV